MSQLLIWGISATPNRPLFVENIFRYNKKIQHRGPCVVVSPSDLILIFRPFWLYLKAIQWISNCSKICTNSFNIFFSIFYWIYTRINIL